MIREFTPEYLSRRNVMKAQGIQSKKLPYSVILHPFLKEGSKIKDRNGVPRDSSSI